MVPTVLDSTPSPGLSAVHPAGGSPPPLAVLAAHAAALVARFDPAATEGESCAGLVPLFEQLVRAGRLGLALAAGRVAETGVWRADGSRSPVAWLCRTADLGHGEAQRVLSLAEQLGRLPALDQLARSGEVSFTKVADAAAVVAQKAAGDRSAAEDELVEAARVESRRAFRETCRTVRFRGEDDAARLARQRAARCGRVGMDLVKDVFAVVFEGAMDAGAEFESLFEPWVEQRCAAARAEGAEVTPAQCRWDALIDVVRAASSGDPSGVPASLVRLAGSRCKLIARVDWDAFERGHTERGEVAEIAGRAAPVSAIRSLVEQGAFLSIVATTVDRDGTDRVDAVAHLGRSPTARASLGDRHALAAAFRAKGRRISQLVHGGRHPTVLQRTALEWMHPCCSVDGCEASYGLEIDHTIPWADTGRTTLAELNRRCGVHHGRKTAEENRHRARQLRHERSAA